MSWRQYSRDQSGGGNVGGAGVKERLRRQPLGQDDPSQLELSFESAVSAQDARGSKLTTRASPTRFSSSLLRRCRSADSCSLSNLIANFDSTSFLYNLPTSASAIPSSVSSMANRFRASWASSNFPNSKRALADRSNALRVVLLAAAEGGSG